MKEEIFTIIKDIENELRADLYKDDLSLMCGASGDAFFFFNLYALTKDNRAKKKGVDILNHISDNLSESTPFSLSNGLAGIAWLFDFLNRNNILEVDVENVLCELDEALVENIENDMQKNNIDFLHGIIGIGLYFVEKNQSSVSLTVLRRIIFFLNDICIKAETGYRWGNYSSFKGYLVNELNLSLSHGLSSIIIFLSKCYLANIETDLTLELLRNSILTIKNNVQNEVIYNSVFPSILNLQEDQKSLRYPRLAWCYGDLGITIALIQANQILKDQKISELIHKSIAFNALKKDTSLIKDNAICHGTAGIALIFDTLHSFTGNKEAKSTYDFWLNHLIKQQDKAMSKSGYRTYDGIDRYYSKSTFLEGSCGVGLVLIDAISPKKNDWKKVLML